MVMAAGVMLIEPEIIDTIPATVTRHGQTGKRVASLSPPKPVVAAASQNIQPEPIRDSNTQFGAVALAA